LAGIVDSAIAARAAQTRAPLRRIEQLCRPTKKQEKAMTQIRGQFVASRRPGELGVHSVNSFHLVVPDLGQAKDFYSAFGPDVKTAGNRLDMYTHGSSHRWGTIGEAPRKQLSYLSFGVFEEDFSPFKMRLQSVGVPQVDTPAGSESNGLWFRSPDGLLIELKASEKTSPNVKSSFDRPARLPASRRPGFGSSIRNAPRFPRRLAHALISTADVSVFGYRIAPATESRSCMASMGATII
jgi:hypothetical protein